jgi:hypothetical protein
MVEEDPRRRVHNTLAFRWLLLEKRPSELLFEPNSSNGRVDIQARSEAEPGTAGPSVSGSRTRRIARLALPQMMRME